MGEARWGALFPASESEVARASRRLLTLPRLLPNGTKKWYDPISASSAVNLQLSSTVNRALRACFPAVNGCAAQHSGQVLMFEGKSCSHFGSYTLLVKNIYLCLLNSVQVEDSFPSREHGVLAGVAMGILHAHIPSV